MFWTQFILFTQLNDKCDLLKMRRKSNDWWNMITTNHVSTFVDVTNAILHQFDFKVPSVVINFLCQHCSFQYAGIFNWEALARRNDLFNQTTGCVTFSADGINMASKNA